MSHRCYLLSLVALALLSPLLVPIAVVFDLVRLRFRLPTVRMVAFIAAYMALDAWAIGMAAQLWARHGFGTRLGTESSIADHSRVQWVWGERLAEAARWTLGLRFEVTSPEPLSPGPVVALGRHASYGDAILPLLLFGSWSGMEVRYVMAIGLAWDPSIDLFGHRLRHHFVDRAAARGTHDLEALGYVAKGMDGDDVAVIFPEGQFPTPERRARAIARIAADAPALAARAERLRHLLPPRPGGALALLDAAPDADVVLIGHVGLEDFGRVVDIWRHVPLRQPVQARTWRFPAADIPTDPDARVAWLYDLWAMLDDWIEAETRRRAG
jgi:1-acyl-sn-glycerol-3-phosphate acyltransferase